MKSQSTDKLILGHLNINLIQNKFDGLKFVIVNKIGIFLISETKSDDSFRTAQFLIEGFGTPYRHDRNTKRWRTTLVYWRRYVIQTFIM